MDTSEQYIKMCDCNEIQEGTAWLLDANDFRSQDGVWLPRQDQLQKMVRDKIDCPSHSSFAISINFGYRLKKLSETDAFHYWNQFVTFEQLWLAFVMKEKYGKIWDGEYWQNGNQE